MREESNKDFGKKAQSLLANDYSQGAIELLYLKVYLRAG